MRVTNIYLRHSPKHVMNEAIEEFGRKYCLALDPFHLFAHRVQPPRTESKVEIVSLVFDIVEIMGEGRFAQERVEMLQRRLRRAGQRLILDENEFRRLLAEERLLERVERVSDRTVTRRKSVDPREDGAAWLEAEHSGEFEGVLAHQQLDRIHDPGDGAHAADESRLRKELR
jgi:hypothetical protein